MKNWLKEEMRLPKSFNFEVIDVSEQTSLTEDIKKVMANEIIKAFRNPEGLKCYFKNKSKTELINYIKNDLFSPLSSGFSLAVRIGDWGEVFTGLYLLKVKEHDIPFYKIRLKHRKDKSVQCLDCLTFDSFNNIINFNEVKTNTAKPNKETAKKAYDELKTEYFADTPLLYHLIMKHLYDNKQYKEADKIDQFYLNNKNNKKANIFLVCDKVCWQENLLDYLNTHSIELENLSVFVILIQDLRTLIDDTYNMTIKIAEEIVYG